jgi:RHS repeat-associated core domain
MATRTAGGQATAYEYDANGNRTHAVLTEGQTTLSDINTTYDRLNRPLEVTVDGDEYAATTYDYDLTSPSWSDPSGSYTATLDAFDRQVELADPIHGSSHFTWSYRADGQLDSIAAPNGTTTTFTYDAAGGASTKTTSLGEDPLAAYIWTHNRAGQILSEDSQIDNDTTNGETSYAYDPLARLVSFTRDELTTAYGWQAVPNRDSVKVGEDPTTTFTFDAANREYDTTPGDMHNDEGQLETRPGQSLAWNDLGQLISVSDTTPDPDVQIAAYTYDALDRLLTVDHGSGDVVRFRYVGLTTQAAQVVDDVTDDVVYSVANDWTGERLVDWTDSGTDQHFYGTNGHHDMTWTADASGDVSAALRYDPWGNLTASWGDYLPAFRFQGSWFDWTVELSWVVARWYAPGLARFISEDSLLGEASQPPSRHLYAYANGDPVLYWDLDGRMASVGDGGSPKWLKLRSSRIDREEDLWFWLGLGTTVACYFSGVFTPGPCVVAGIAVAVITANVNTTRLTKWTVKIRDVKAGLGVEVTELHGVEVRQVLGGITHVDLYWDEMPRRVREYRFANENAAGWGTCAWTIRNLDPFDLSGNRVCYGYYQSDKPTLATSFFESRWFMPEKRSTARYGSSHTSHWPDYSPPRSSDDVRDGIFG